MKKMELHIKSNMTVKEKIIENQINKIIGTQGDLLNDIVFIVYDNLL